MNLQTHQLLCEVVTVKSRTDVKLTLQSSKKKPSKLISVPLNTYLDFFSLKKPKRD